MTSRQLITGGTGFFGAALALELLAESADELVFLVRDGAEDPRERLLAALRTAAAAYAVPDELIDDHVRRITVTPGDLSTVDEVRTGPVDRVWHSAASLRYRERDADEIRAVNVEGTRRALDLAANLAARSFHYVSTSYVAGTVSGEITEEPVPASSTANNHYERSKIDAEALVLAQERVSAQVLRPSILVGHSRTHATLSDFGLYGFLSRLLAFRDQYGAAELTLVADPDAPVNLIPIDLAVRQAVRIADSPERAPIAHVTNERPPSIGKVLDVVFDCAGLPRPRYAGNREQLAEVDRGFDRAIDFYRSYITGHKTFRQRAARAVAEPLSFAFTRDRLIALCDDHLKRTRVQENTA